jgi:hypothetical protein
MRPDAAQTLVVWTRPGAGKVFHNFFSGLADFLFFLGGGGGTVWPTSPSGRLLFTSGLRTGKN